jgi:membrane protease YdiL (CAAX protease family)
MDRLELSLEPEGSAWQKRWQALFEVLLLTGIVSALLAFTPFSLYGQTSERVYHSARLLTEYILLESAITLFFLILILKSHRETLLDLGLIWSEWKPNLFVGILLVPLLFAVNELTGICIYNFFPEYISAQNPLLETIRTPTDLALFLVVSMFAGGIKEELQRAFILSRFRAHLGGAKAGLVIWSIAFGMGHYAQGVQAIISATLFGFTFGCVYLVRRNLIAPVVAHGLYDVCALLGFWFFKGLVP